MGCDAWLRFPTRDLNLSAKILFEAKDHLMFFTIKSTFIWAGIPAVSGYVCPSLGMFCALSGVRPLPICGERGGHLCVVARRFEEAMIWSGSPGLKRRWDIIPKSGPLWWVWQCHRQIYALKTIETQYSLWVCTLALMAWNPVGIYPWGVSDCVGTGVLTDPTTMICP